MLFYFFNLAPGAALFALVLAWGAAAGPGLAAAWWRGRGWGRAPLLMLCAWGPGAQLSPPAPAPLVCSTWGQHCLSGFCTVFIPLFFFLGVFVTLPSVGNDAGLPFLAGAGSAASCDKQCAAWGPLGGLELGGGR